MEILSKGGFSLPVVLGFLMEVFSLACLANNTDLISTAGSSLSSSSVIASTNTSYEKNSRSDAGKTASYALENALNSQTQSSTPGFESPTDEPSQSSSELSNSAEQNNSVNDTSNTPQKTLHSRSKNHATSAADNLPEKQHYKKFLLPHQSHTRSSSPIQEEATKTEKPPLRGYIEAGGQNYAVTNDQGNWNDQYLIGVFQTNDKDVWTIGLEHDHRFHQKGDYGTLENTHVINDDWYTSAAVGISDNSNFIPKYFLGATVYHKQGPKKQIVGYLGGHAYWFRPTQTVQDINPGFIYYFETPWVLEAGAYINHGNPGAVYSATGYAAITQGTDKDHYYTLRYGFGKEAYLPLDTGATVVGYPSTVVTATWRKWVGKNWGFNVSGEYYHNPFYNRYGGTYGLFMDFA